MTVPPAAAIDLRFLEHPSLGIVALRANIDSADVESFISWIRRVLTPVAEENAWSNLPRSLNSDSPIGAALIEACSQPRKRASDADYSGYGGYRPKRPMTSGMLFKCFVCGQTGHKSTTCPQNTGGSAAGGYGGSSYNSYDPPSGYGGGRPSISGANLTAIGSQPSPSGGGYGGYDSGGYGTVEPPVANSPVRALSPPARATSSPPKAEEGALTTTDGAALENESWVPQLHLIKKETNNFYDLSSGED